MSEKMIFDGIGENETTARVVSLLKEKGFTVSFAESCTGGAAAARLVSIPDASYVLSASLVTYANEAKVRCLGVLPETVDAYGVVSEQVAKEMAQGVARVNSAEIGVSVSGIAGPSGATDKKPVGTVCFGFSVLGKTYTYTKYFGALGRNSVRSASVDFIYEKLYEILCELK